MRKGHLSGGAQGLNQSATWISGVMVRENLYPNLPKPTRTSVYDGVLILIKPIFSATNIAHTH
jgi:hypothetical protein